MCGRYSLTTPLEGLREIFLFEEIPNLAPRYNIAPTQDVPVLRLGRDDGKRHLRLLRWGLIPFWAKDAAIGSRMINARSESLAEKPAFREAFRKRRCLVLADGFYEWQAPPEGAAPRTSKAKTPKQPYRITLAGGGPFAFAGLWERWHDKAEDRKLDSFTIVTTEANKTLSPIHHRMPVILAPADHATWLDPESRPADLQALLRPAPEAAVKAEPISTRINAVRHDDASVLAPPEPAAPAPAEAAPEAPSAVQGRLF